MGGDEASLDLRVGLVALLDEAFADVVVVVVVVGAGVAFPIIFCIPPKQNKQKLFYSSLYIYISINSCIQ